jgi:hypothetical protein
MAQQLGRISGPLLENNLLRRNLIGADSGKLDDANLAFETDLLFLDIINGRIGMTTDSTQLGIDLLVPNEIRTDGLVVDTDIKIDSESWKISSDEIRFYDLSTLYIQPNQATNPRISGPRFGTDNIHVSNQLIENVIADSSIELSPSGTGIVEFNTYKVNIDGELYVTGKFTVDGTSTFIGSDDNDSVYFNSDINSNLIPNIDDEHDLGSLIKEWGNLYTYTVYSNTLTVNDSFIVNDIELSLTQGNTLYVSINGNDTNHGDHQHSTFRTLKYALSQAVSGDEIIIFPGEYEEEFPLVVPQGVSVRGTGIRAVSVEPTISTNNNDAFLLNGDTTVEFLTIRNFYTGYGFKLALNFKSIARSPYISNVTVITRGSVTTVSDPLGYNEGDAGGGAYIDGSVADPTGTIPPTCLFYAVTFITPNADGITAKNGVRIEWLNSFTYYAKKGIHLLNGTEGLYNQSLIFGAEFRSINSANVYGEYGAVADGDSTIAYLVGHNFGYVGSREVDYNDGRQIIQANEVVESNDGTIYYESQDQKGDFRIGSIFYVEQETGNVVFDARSINFGSDGYIILEGPTSVTYVDKYLIQTGNIRIHDNEIQSLLGPVNFLAASNNTYLNTNVFVTGTLNVTDSFIVAEDIWFGNQTSDLINFVSYLSQDINPNQHNFLELGTSSKRWNTLFATLVDIDDVVEITNNTISTLTTDTDLELVANNNGKIQISTTNVQIDQNLTVDDIFTVNGLTTILSVEINGNILHTGNINQTGDFDLIGTFANNNIIINGDSYFEVPSIRLYDNIISEQQLDTDIQFLANGTGGVALDSKLKITDNNISNFWTGASTNLQKSVILTPNGIGHVEINSTKSVILPIGNNTNRLLSSVGEVRYNDVSNMVEGWSPSGYVNFMNLWDSDRNTYITAELTPGNNDQLLRFGINGTVTTTINDERLFNNRIHVDNIYVQGNNVGNLVSTNDVNLIPTGTGIVNVNDIHLIDNTITNNLDTAIILTGTNEGYIKFSGKGGVVLPYGPTADRRLTPELGEMRFNSDINYMEVYNGTDWQAAVGDSPTVSAEEAEDIMDIWTLILG